MTTHKQRFSFPTQFLGWLIIALFVLGGTAAILEIAARIFLPNINVLLNIVIASEDNRHFVLKPSAFTLYSGLYEKSSKIIEWRINSQGLRSDQNISNKSNSKFRIATYGDSETFGWSVDLQDTWQQQMQDRDQSIEVINLGVPGYNIDSIATHVEKTLSTIQPDMAIYLFNKNDVYKSLSYHPQWSKSYLYLIINMGLYQLKAKQRKEWRNSAKGAEYFRTHLHRIINVCKQQNIPLLLAVQHWKYINVFPAELQNDQSSKASGNSGNVSAVQTINVENAIEEFPRRDAHMTEPAHAALANVFCDYISNGTINRCRP